MDTPKVTNQSHLSKWCEFFMTLDMRANCYSLMSSIPAVIATLQECIDSGIPHMLEVTSDEYPMSDSEVAEIAKILDIYSLPYTVGTVRRHNVDYWKLKPQLETPYGLLVFHTTLSMFADACARGAYLGTSFYPMFSCTHDLAYGPFFKGHRDHLDYLDVDIINHILASHNELYYVRKVRGGENLVLMQTNYS